MSTNIEIPDFEKLAQKLINEAKTISAVEAKRFFQDTFRKKGFTDTAFEEWEETTNPFKGSGTMYKGGHLMGSIRRNDAEFSKNRVIIESNTRYSKINNEGGHITVTPRMKKFFWIKYAEIAQVPKVGDKYLWSKAKRPNHPKAVFCKSMALLETGAKIKIPKRQFMGHSTTMMQQIEKAFFDIMLAKWKETF